MRLAWARQMESWNHTAQVLCMLRNANRGRDDEPTDPSDHHPMFITAPLRKASLFALRGVKPPAT